MIESYESFSKGNVRGADACSFAKTRVRQDAERSLRDAGAPRGEISFEINWQGTLSERSGGGRSRITPNAAYLHPALSFANKAGESGRMIESYESFSKGNVRGADACSFAKTRVRQDAERSLRDAGAPHGEISVPLSFSLACPLCRNTAKIRVNLCSSVVLFLIPARSFVRKTRSFFAHN
jgi:hypothetical protein